MPRWSKDRVPSMRLHKRSGQAVVTLDGRDRYLGKFGSDQARERYDSLIAEWLATGRRLLAAESESSLTVNELVLAYWRHAESYYLKNGKPTRELANIKLALRNVRRLYGTTSAKDFGPLRLKAVRQDMVEAGHGRKHINKQVDRVKRMFRWGAEEELVPGSVYHALRAVTGLRFGRTTAHESEPVCPVSERDMQAVLPLLPRPVAAMVLVQWFCGCRPHEVVQMRMQDIDRSGKVWIYRPRSHKTEHHGHERLIALGPKAQEVIRPLLRLDGGYLFRPCDAVEQQQRTKRQNRRTPLWPSHLQAQSRKRKKAPKRKPAECYTTDSYRRAIHRACEKASVSKWSPNQLRHARATEVRKRFGLEAAQVTLGHACADITQVYAERNLDLAIKVAQETG